MSKRTMAMVAACVAAACVGAAADRAHVRTIETAVTTPDEGFLIGNGDLSCSIYQETDAVVFRLGKGDVWDRRVDTNDCIRPPTVREFIDGVLKEGWTVSDWSGSKTESNGKVKDPKRFKEIFRGKTPRKNIAPRPKPTGEFRVFTPMDLPAPRVRQRLFIEEARVEIALNWPENGIGITIDAVVAPDENVLAVQWRTEGWNDETRYGYDFDHLAPVWCGLMRWADPDWREWAAKVQGRVPLWPTMKWPDNILPRLPPPGQAVVGGERGVEQRFQPDEDYPQGFAYRMFLLADKTKGVIKPLSYDQDCEEWVRYVLRGENATSGEVAVAVCTTRDGNLDKAPARRPFEEYRAAAKAAAAKQAAERCWAKSALTVPGDRFLEDAWYAVWHTRRSVLKPGAVPPGLFLPSTIGDFPRWNGDYHGNYNMQSIYWGEMTADRLEQAECYFDMIDYARPLGEKIAREYYGCRGCFIQLEGFAVHTLHDPHGTLPLGRMAYMTGWAMTKYWEYYQYTRDRDWLAKRGYPFMKDCALFYLDFLKKAPHPDLPPELKDGKYHVFPSVQGESGWKKPMDLCDRPQVLKHAAYCLWAACRAAETLGVDADLVAQWTERYENLPGAHTREDQFGGENLPYQLHCWWAMPADFGHHGVPWRPAAKYDGKPWKRGNDFYGYPGINHYSKICDVRAPWMIPDRDYPRWRETLRHWMHPNGLVTAMSASRWERVGWTESFACVAPFQDMLLQSWDGAIRLFPRWKMDIDVAFRDFRAEGAFLVSAALTGGKIHGVKVRSLMGEDCLVHGDWQVVDAAGGTVATDRDRFGRLRFKTVKGGVYALSPAPRKP